MPRGLCDADDAVIRRIDGDELRSGGPLRVDCRHGGVASRRQSDRGSVAGRAVVDRRTIHIHDLAAEPEAEFPEASSAQQRVGIRTVLATPLLREGIADR